MTDILILNGPNLNLLGVREPHIYGADTLEDVRTRCDPLATAAGLSLDLRQSNHEGQLVDWIQQGRETVPALILNAGAFTHYSIAIHDALRAFEGMVIELHVSNPHLREGFRHGSFVGGAATGVIAGMGVRGYEAATRIAVKRLTG